MIVCAVCDDAARARVRCTDTLLWRPLLFGVDTLIVWNEPHTDLDYALSFQQAAGCMQIWDQIQVRLDHVCCSLVWHFVFLCYTKRIIFLNIRKKKKNEKGKNILISSFISFLISISFDSLFIIEFQ